MALRSRPGVPAALLILALFPPAARIEAAIPSLGHPVEKIVWGHDGLSMAVVSPNGAVRLWGPDQKTGWREIPGVSQASAAAFSQDSRMLALGAASGRVFLLDRSQSTPPVELGNHSAPVQYLAFGSAGLVSASDGAVRVWDVAARKLLREIDLEDGRILSLAQNGGELWVARRNELVVYDVVKGQKLRTIPAPEIRLPCRSSSSLTWLASVQNFETVVLQGIADSSRSCETEKHDRLGPLELSPDGWLLATGDSQGLHVWDAVTGKRLLRLGTQGHAVKSLAFSPRGDWLAVGGEAGLLALWRVSGIQPRRSFQQRAALSGIKYLDDDRILGATHLGELSVWNDATGAVEDFGKVQGHVEQLAITPKRSLVAITITSAGSQGVCIWDPAKRVELVKCAAKDPWRACFVGEEPALVTAGYRGKVELWELPSGKGPAEIDQHRRKIAALAASDDALTIASSCEDTIRLWNINKRMPSGTLRNSAAVECLAFQPRGKLLAVGGRDGKITLWDWKTGECGQAIQASPDPVTSLAFSPDGTTLAANGQDSACSLWQVESARLLFAYEPAFHMMSESRSLRSIEFSPSGKSLALGRSNAIEVWTNVVSRQESLELLVRRLTDGDVASVYRDMIIVACRGDEAVDFLAQPLKESRPDGLRVRKLIAELDSDSFADRRDAARQLQDFGVVIKPYLEDGLKDAKTAQVKQTLKSLLAAPDIAQEETRTLRAIQILEHIGSPKAVGLLTWLARYAPSGLLGSAAQAALERCEQRKPR